MVSATKRTKVTIAIRVPGIWNAMEEIAARLPKGYRIGDGRLWMPGGRCVDFGTMEADAILPGLFVTGCSRGLPLPGERFIIERYKMKATLAGPGGSHKAARLMLEAGAALVRAGGAGVFIDNSGLAHGGENWLELETHSEDPVATYFAFIRLYHSRGLLRSWGMQVLGKPDIVLESEYRGTASAIEFESLMRPLATEPWTLRAGEIYHDADGNPFRLRKDPRPDPYQLPEGHLHINPHGRYEIVRL